MGLKGVMRLFVAVVVAFSWLSVSASYKFYVGGRDGWVVKPSEEYNHWAERNRFQVDDTLFFKYKKGEDSVLVVSRDNYVHCYTKTPIQTLTEGDSEFKFNRSGAFYFISGNEDHCKQGQKLIVVVMAVRPRAPPSPAQGATPPQAPPSTPAPPPEAVPPESGAAGGSPSGSNNTSGPALAPTANFAARRVGGSLGLVALCLGVLGVTVLFSN